MRTIDLPQLRTILAAVKGTTMVSFVAVTDSRCRVKNNPHIALGPVYKVAKVNATVGAEHQNSVNRRQAQEGVISPAYVEQKDRSWGTRLSSALVKKGDDYYLPAQINSTRANPIYLAPQMVGGKVRLVPVPTSQIAPFLPSGRREEHAAQQGVTRSVERRDYRLSSLAYVSINGEQLRIRS